MHTPLQHDCTDINLIIFQLFLPDMLSYTSAGLEPLYLRHGKMVRHWRMLMLTL